MSDFPLCEKAGLRGVAGVLDNDRKTPSGDYFINAQDVEDFLGNAPVMNDLCLSDPDATSPYEWFQAQPGDATHNARLILIEPINHKSREEKLEDLIRTAWAAMKDPMTKEQNDWWLEARAMLKEKE